MGKKEERGKEMMHKKGILILFLAAVLLAALSVGCIGQQRDGSLNAQSPAINANNPREYFPTVGRWSYKIELGETTPLLYVVTEDTILRTPLFNEKYFQAIKKNGPYYLTMKVQSRIEYDNGREAIELNIVEDDLGLLMKPTHFLWIIPGQEEISAGQIAYYDEAVSFRPIFFLPPSDDIDWRISYAVGEEDTLRFVGFDNSVPGCSNQGCMHFIREVIKGSGAYGYADNGFKDETFFAKGKGLVYFRQTVEVPGKGNQVSMNWTLDQFSAK